MKSQYFKIQEFVSKEVYNKYAEKSWEFIDDRLIITMDTLRKELNKPIIINNWLWGGNLKQRGLRANKDEIVTNKKDFYISQHCLGKAVDFNVKDMSSKEVFDFIMENLDKFPFIKRIEDYRDTPSWTHIDVANTDKKGVYVFRA